MLTENETRSLTEFTNKFFGLDLSENLKPIAISELNKFKKIHKIMDLGYFLSKYRYDLQDDKILDLLEIFLIPHTNLFSENFTFQYLLGTAYYQIKDYGNSKIYLENALGIFPQSKNTKHNLALIYDAIGKWDESDKLYMELIASDSTDAQAYNNYAYSLVERGENIEFALELAKNAVRLEPESAAYLDTIGWIYFKLSLHDEALIYISESIGIDSNNVTIREHYDEIMKVKADKNYRGSQQVEN